VSKLAGELYVHALGMTQGLETVVLRYFNVYGPGQDPASEYAAVIPRFVNAVTRGVRPTINGTGSISRDFVHVADVVAANILAASSSARTGLTCNIATAPRRPSSSCSTKSAPRQAGRLNQSSVLRARATSRLP
jgi:nucleoside-diphosphate-sugar epimerase